MRISVIVVVVASLAGITSFVVFPLLSPSERIVAILIVSAILSVEVARVTKRSFTVLRLPDQPPEGVPSHDDLPPTLKRTPEGVPSHGDLPPTLKRTPEGVPSHDDLPPTLKRPPEGVPSHGDLPPTLKRPPEGVPSHGDLPPTLKRPPEGVPSHGDLPPTLKRPPEGVPSHGDLPPTLKRPPEGADCSVRAQSLLADAATHDEADAAAIILEPPAPAARRTDAAPPQDAAARPPHDLLADAATHDEAASAAIILEPPALAARRTDAAPPQDAAARPPHDLLADAATHDEADAAAIILEPPAPAARRTDAAPPQDAAARPPHDLLADAATHDEADAAAIILEPPAPAARRTDAAPPQDAAARPPHDLLADAATHDEADAAAIILEPPAPAARRTDAAPPQDAAARPPHDLLADAATHDEADAAAIILEPPAPAARRTDDAPPQDAAARPPHDLLADAATHDEADAAAIILEPPAPAARRTDAAPPHDEADVGEFVASTPIRIRSGDFPKTGVSLITGNFRLSTNELRARMVAILSRMVREHRDEWEAWLVALMMPVRQSAPTIGVAVLSAFSRQLVERIESSAFRSFITGMTWEPRWGTRGMDVLRLTFDARALQNIDDRHPQPTGRSDVWLPIGVSQRPTMMVYYPFGVRRTIAITTPTWSHQLLQRITTAWAMSMSSSLAVYNPANIPLTLLLPGESHRHLSPVSRSDLLSPSYRAFLVIRANAHDDHDLHSILVQRPERVMIIDGKDGGTPRTLYRSLGWLALSGGNEGTAHIMGTTLHVCASPHAEGVRSDE